MKAKHGLKDNNKNKSKHIFLRCLFDIFITAFVVSVLFIIWQVWWTNIHAQTVQQHYKEVIKWVEPAEKQLKIAKRKTENYPTILKQEEETIIAKVYIPRFGNDYFRFAFEGTDKQMLDTMGFGHYTNTAQVGAKGIFAIAAHRNGYGASLENIQDLQTGDAIVIRTAMYWFVYNVAGYKIVSPKEVSVLHTAPEYIGNPNEDRLIELITCHPKWSTDFRYVVYGKISYWANIEDGIPQELSEVKID